MKCPVCGEELKNNYCQSCGAYFAPESKHKNNESGVDNHGETTKDPNAGKAYKSASKPKKFEKNKWVPLIVLLLGFISSFGKLQNIKNDISSLFGGIAKPATIQTSVQINSKAKAVDQASSQDYDLLQAVYKNPDNYKNQQICIGGKVDGEPEKDSDGAWYFYLYGDPDNYEHDTIIKYEGKEVPVRDGQYILVDGYVYGQYMYKGNQSGEGKHSILQFVAQNIKQSDYTSAVAPTVKSMSPENASVTQKNCTVTIEKIEFAKNQTRVFFEVKNNGLKDFELSDYNISLNQNGQDIDSISADESALNLLDADLKKGNSCKGIAAFKEINTEQPFIISADGYSSDSQALKPYEFHFH